MSDISARMTPSVIDTQVLSGLQADQTGIANLAEILSTGNKVNKPSDNPIAAVQTLSLQATLARSQQYQANASDGMSRLQLTNSTLNSVLSQMQKIRQLVISAANSVTTANGLGPVAAQVAQLEQGMVSLANTTFGNEPLFGGATGSATAYAVTVPQNGTGGSAQYLGSGSAPSRTVGPGSSVPAGLANPFNGTATPNTGTAGPTAGTVDVFGVLNQLVRDLQSGNAGAATGTDATQLDQAITQVTSAAGEAGAYYAQMNTLSLQAASTTQEVQLQFSNVQSADLAKVSSDFAQAQTTYQGALYAAAQVTKLPSLVSFLS